MTVQPMANGTDGSIIEEHTLAIPPVCPISKNPQSATITIRYIPRGKSLEIYSLTAYLHSFIGGLKNEQGVVMVRDMEAMVQRIQIDCEEALGVPVEVETSWQILPAQEVHMRSVTKVGEG